MTARDLIKSAQVAEIRLESARSDLAASAAGLQSRFEHNAPWLVPLLGIGAGLILARVPSQWHNRLLRHGLPMLGGGVFSLVTPFLRR